MRRKNDEARMTKDEGMGKLFGDAPRFWGARAPSRAHFGALAEIASVGPMRSARVKVRDHEGVIASTRGACAPQNP
jgi:hypothetical protein